jgi:predicted nucleic acid-binding protein
MGAIHAIRKVARSLSHANRCLHKIRLYDFKYFHASAPTLLAKQRPRFHLASRDRAGRVCVRAMELAAAYPKDPADRIIGATALAEGIPLVTADSHIRSAKTLRTVW